jgi:hypothetical protein
LKKLAIIGNIAKAIVTIFAKKKQNYLKASGTLKRTQRLLFLLRKF